MRPGHVHTCVLSVWILTRGLNRPCTVVPHRPVRNHGNTRVCRSENIIRRWLMIYVCMQMCMASSCRVMKQSYYIVQARVSLVTVSLFEPVRCLVLLCESSMMDEDPLYREQRSGAVFSSKQPAAFVSEPAGRLDLSVFSLHVHPVSECVQWHSFNSSRICLWCVSPVLTCSG